MVDISPILDDCITREVSTKEALAIEILDKKQIAEIVKTLSPLGESLRHCKRVRVKDEILCLISEIDESRFDKVRKVKIPDGPVYVKKQFEDAKTFWPIHFHPNAELEKLIAKETENIWGNPSYHSNFLLQREEEVVVVDPDSGKIFVTGETGKHPLDHAVMGAVSMISKKDSKYLATGLDVYLRNEPCAMCAMALVHMRVKRIFFLNENLEKGALKSKMKLHTLSGINHVFQVYHISSEK